MTLSRRELQEVLDSLVGVFDGAEVVDEHTHALQSADAAIRFGSDPQMVIAALLHDVARSPLIPEGGSAAHELVGAAWLRERLPVRVAWLVGAHVAAKLYLLEVDPSYEEFLSPESVASARLQRASFDRSLVGHRWWPDALRLRRFDDEAKDPDAALPDLSGVLRACEGLLGE